MLRAMVVRNLKLYFRDRISVFFSLLGVMVIILIYILFLGNMIADEVGNFAGDVARFFTDSWVMAGVIASASITTCLGGLGLMVEDRARKITMDFESSPLPRAQLVLSYVIAAVIIGLVMTTFTLLLGELYIVIYGGRFLSFPSLLKVLGIIILTVSASSAMVFLMVATVRTPSAFGTLSTLVGTLIGFLTGVYVPIGNFPEFIQRLIKVVPVSHAAVALRQVMMDEAVPLAHIPEEVRVFMGIQFQFGNRIMPFWGHLSVLLATFVGFYALSVLIMANRKQKE